MTTWICCHCRESLANQTWTCSRCGTTIHAECYEEHGQCPIYGCSVVRWGHLTPEHVDAMKKRKILNGCGGKGAWVNAPDFLFEASCWHHDFNYWVGGDEADRLKADWEFYQAMLRDVDRFASWWNGWWYRSVAWTYYQAVRRFAGRKNEDGTGRFFHYGRRRTRKDLEDLLSAAR